MMNQEQVKGKFKQLEGLAKQEWSKLTDKDFQEGSIDRVIGRITELYGVTKAEAQSKLNEILSKIDEGTGRESGGGLGSNIHKMTDKISDYAEQGQKKLEEAADSIKHQSEEWYQYIDKSMKEKPLATLAIALGVGALLGSIISR